MRSDDVSMLQTQKGSMTRGFRIGISREHPVSKDTETASDLELYTLLRISSPQDRRR